MVDLSKFENDSILLGFCTTDYLNTVDIKEIIYKKGVAKKPKDYLVSARTIIVIGTVGTFDKDIYKRTLLTIKYPGYDKAYNISKEIASYLEKEGYKSKVAFNINQKTAAVQAGLGVWGKSSLVINPIHGTHLRFSSVVTDWIPNIYSKPLNIDLYGGCTACIDACPYNCIKLILICAIQNM